MFHLRAYRWLVNYRKVDAALASALRKPPARLPVFVHLDPDASEAEHASLASLGLPAGSLQGAIATASLSPAQVRKLSDQPFVRQIRLSSPMNLLGDG